MDRERLEDLMTGLLDDELTSEERSELELELEASAEARELLESYRTHSQGLQALEPLKVPEQLRDETKSRIDSEPIPLKPTGSRNFLWLVGTMAASLLFFWASSVTRVPTPAKFYLAQEGLVSQAAGQTFSLYLTGVQETHVLHSQKLQGVLAKGGARAVLECDAGQVEGTTLKLKLSFDLDGDDQYDLIQESESLVFDREDGYELITCDFPPLSDQYSGEVIRGKVRLELIGQSLQDSGLALQFHPERAHLTLPLENERVL
jgi:hypothetical protein